MPAHRPHPTRPTTAADDPSSARAALTSGPTGDQAADGDEPAADSGTVSSLPVDVADRITRYVPEGLPASAWHLARPGVQAAVSSARPVSPEDAKGLLSRLCLFLAGPCGWDRTSRPDLAPLLSEATIAAHLDRLQADGKSSKTRENHRADLRRLHRAVTDTDPPAAHSAGAPGLGRQVPPSRSGRWWAARAHLTVPFTLLVTVARGLRVATGRDVLDPLAAELTKNPAALRSGRTADSHSVGTSPQVKAIAGRSGGVTVPAARAQGPAASPGLYEATDVSSRKATTATYSTPTTPRTDSTPPARTRATFGSPSHQTQPTAKPMSRAARLRYAKEHAAATEAVTRRAQEGPTPAPPVPIETLPEPIRTALLRYRPQALPERTWATVGPLVRRLVIGYAPTSPGAATNAASHITGFVTWAATHAPAASGPTSGPAPGSPPDALPGPDPRLLLQPGLLERYLQDVPAPAGTLATRRTVIRRALRALSGDPAPAVIAYQPVAAPYEPAECTRLARLARHQPTGDRRRQLSLLVGLGLGAGLDGRDLRFVHRDDFRDVALPDGTPVLTVAVCGGERPRTLVVRRAYEALVRDGLRLHDAARRGAKAPLLGVKDTRRNITTPVRANAVTARDGVGVDIEVNRLRATWLVACMNAAVPLSVLLPAAGLRSARTLTDLLTHCPTPDPEVAAAALSACPDANTTSPYGPATRGRSSRTGVTA